MECYKSFVSQTVIVTGLHRVFKKPYTWVEVPPFNVKRNNVIDHGCNRNDGGILYSESETFTARSSISYCNLFWTIKIIHW
jgi:hypothetical protein